MTAETFGRGLAGRDPEHVMETALVTWPRTRVDD